MITALPERLYATFKSDKQPCCIIALKDDEERNRVMAVAVDLASGEISVVDLKDVAVEQRSLRRSL